jgi:hypothetical protein|tara:strand:- start:739 stop:1020 length:282 start_codon:yes stop_codon:yes gene_type:complete
MKQLDWKSFVIGVFLTTTLVLGSGAKLAEQVVDSYPKEHLAFRTKSNNEFSDKEFSKKINELGNSGWELCDVESIQKDGNTTERIYFFKRPKN